MSTPDVWKSPPPHNPRLPRSVLLDPKYTRSRFRVSALIYTYEFFPLRAVRVVRRSVRLLKGKAGGQDRNDGLLKCQTRYLRDGSQCYSW